MQSATSLELFQIISVLSALITAITAGVAVYFSYLTVKTADRSIKQRDQQFQYDRRLRRMEIHSRFQSTIRELQKTFPEDVNTPHWKPAPEHERAITLYWYLIFDEWFICMEGGPDLESLWKKYYIEGVKSALRIPAFRERISNLLKGDSTFIGKSKEFEKVIDDLTREVHGRGIIRF